MSRFGMKTREDFDKALQSFVEGCKVVYEAYKAKFCPGIPDKGWELTRGQKYVRIVHDGSAHSFVDMETGDVLKPAGWNKPAKHARGNIYDENNGLKFMGPHGPAYLR